MNKFKRDIYDSLAKSFNYKKKKKSKHPKKRHKRISLADFIEKDSSPNQQKIKTEISAKINYKKFLKSKYWLKVKLLVLERDNKTCQVCGTKKSLHVHHKTYEHHFNELEHLEDLITLCKLCHEKEHNIKPKK